MTGYRRACGRSCRRRDELAASTSQRKTLSPPGPAGEFFLRPQSPAHRRYEALRAYLAEGLPAAEAAARSGYSPASLLSAVRDFRAGAREFFVTGRPGPKTAPRKDAARPRIIELHAAGHSIDETAAALAAEGIPLNRTGIADVIAAVPVSSKAEASDLPRARLLSRIAVSMAAVSARESSS
jgi:hypothetical protein